MDLSTAFKTSKMHAGKNVLLTNIYGSPYTYATLNMCFNHISTGKIRLSILKLRIGASYLIHLFNQITHSLAFSGSYESPRRNQPWTETSIDVVRTGGNIRHSSASMIGRV